jgi:hypothetical protein
MRTQALLEIPQKVKSPLQTYQPSIYVIFSVVMNSHTTTTAATTILTIFLLLFLFFFFSSSSFSSSCCCGAQPHWHYSLIPPAEDAQILMLYLG